MMGIRLPPLIATAIALAALNSPPILAHGGRLDGQGCHNNRKTGDYHCHRGATDSLLLSQTHSVKATITGSCRVADGDTVWVDGSGASTEVRLQGVAAPEDPEEPGGKEATTFLRTFCDGKPVRCDLDGSKTRGREVGICYVNDADIGAAVISAGLARDCAGFSGGRYAGLEKPEAKHLAYPGYCSPR